MNSKTKNVINNFARLALVGVMLSGVMPLSYARPGEQDAKHVVEKKLQSYFDSAAQGDVESMRTLGMLYRYGKKGVKKDMRKAVEWYKKAAAKQDPVALYDLGRIYENSEGVEQDPVKAFIYYREAAGLNHSGSMYALGKLFHDGKLIPGDPRRAVEWYTKAVNLGDRSGEYGLAELYRTGVGVEKDIIKSFEYYIRAAEEGSKQAEASFRLGKMYMDGSGGMPINVQEGIKMIYKAAKGNHIEAIKTLADMCYSGSQMKKNYKKAAGWYTRAAKEGDLESLRKIAFMNERGEGFKQDFGKAMKLYKRCIKKRDSEAMYNLGEMYYYGKGTKVNYTEAYKWFSKSHEYGNSSGLNIMGKILLYGHGYKVDHKKALEFFQKSSEQENGVGTYYLGFMYSHGLGIEPDKEKAEKMFVDAKDWIVEKANEGDIEAIARLGSMYRFGRGVEKDIEKAYELYRKAADYGNYHILTYLGDMHLNGTELSHSPQKSLKYYTQAEKLGDLEAPVRRASLLLAQGGDEESKKQAMDILMAEVEKENIKAYKSLGELYYSTGKEFEGKALLIDAASHGDVHACDMLASIYYENDEGEKVYEYLKRGVELNSTYGMTNLGFLNFNNGFHDAGISLYKKAAVRGDEDGMFRFALAIFELERENEYMLAFEYMSKAAENNVEGAWYHLGLMYDTGKGVEQNYYKARECMVKSAEKNSVSEAMMKLGIYYRDGIGGEKNNEKSDYYIRIAADYGNEEAKKYLNSEKK